MDTFDISTLPLPSELGVIEDLQHLSVIFDKQEPIQMLKVSEDATTPLWLNRKLYTKIKHGEG